MADVQNNKFVIGNATVMLAPYSTNVFTLNPDQHSVGMVKAVTVTQEADQIALRNGVMQLQVDAVKSNVSMTTTFEGYEFSAKNLMTSLGLQGTVVKRLRGSLSANAAAAATSLSIISYPVPGEANSGITVLGDIPSGSTLLLQKAGQPDNVYVVKTTAATTGTGTFMAPITALPAGVTFSTGDTVWVVNEIAAGSIAQDQYFCAKIVGTLSANDEPIVVVIPKVRVTRGFNLSFSETDYSNLPFELAPVLMSKNEVTGQAHLTGFDKTIAKAYVGG